MLACNCSGVEEGIAEQKHHRQAEHDQLGQHQAELR